ncbi:hypothetical protein [Gordonia metallireducens]|uniref:hypothetical protein n=1 Tax=Gordonia metallireducens TaxID=2897779 RepID=UPI001E391DF4|nr:hypothetical protein [Gordonia metallireducens]
MNVPPGGHTEVNPDGSATVYDRDGNPVSHVARPWAFDSRGQPQKTSYTGDENGDLIQHVEPAADARYPILADPTQTSHLIPQPGDAGFIGPVTSEQQAQARAEQAEQTPSTNEGLADLLTAPITDPPTTTGTEPSPTRGAEPTPGQQLSYGDWAANNYLGQDVGQDAPQQPPHGDKSGLSELLTAGITDQPSGPEPERSPTQGAEPAPGQQLSYNDWLANNYLGQDVGVVNVRTGADGQPEYYRTAPDGTDTLATTAQTAPNGGLIYGFEDGTVIATDIGDGVSALIEVHPDDTIRIEHSDGLSYDIRPDGNVSLVRIPNNADTRGALFSTAMEGARGLLEAGGLVAQPGRHALNPGEAAAAARWLRILGKGAGPAGTIAAIGAGGIDLANGAPVPETVGSTVGGLAGATLGGAAGAGVGTFAGVATAAAIGAGAGSVVPVVGTVIGAAVGAGIGAWVGSSYGRSIGEGARNAWNKLFG